MLAKKDNIFILEGQGKISAVKTWQPRLTPREEDWVAGAGAGEDFSVYVFLNIACITYFLKTRKQTKQNTKHSCS